MSTKLKRKQRDALESIRKATDFEDGRVGGSENFVRLGDIGPGIGDITLRYLLDHGLIVAGPNRFFNETGYRITKAGRDALNEPQEPTPTPRRRKLKPMPSRLAEPKSRLSKQK
ncbi:hypothetical protein [Salipiger profundus]|uniref:hypothetical protein n=1 Tax=Salipiger profundus TaxID=1229727 RepID=UPI0008E7104A|nr:hypothetical protein [Salipiger profundus]SFD16882.1 hypothetical protein SAMN05444415_10832 [Salipiger profundus]